MEFQFNAIRTYTDAIEIEDIGNASIRVITEEEECYYYATKTADGKISTLEFGPMECGVGILNKFNLKYTKEDFKMPQIKSDITTFINAPKNKQRVENVQTISRQELLGELKLCTEDAHSLFVETTEE